MISHPIYCNVHYSPNPLLRPLVEHSFTKETSHSKPHGPTVWSRGNRLANIFLYFAQHNLIVHMAQQDTPLFDLQDLDHEELANHKRAKRNIARQRQFKRDTDRAEKLVRLKRELIRKTEWGELGLIWRNQERRAPGVKRIKKEEPSSPIIKSETPPSPKLEWPPTPLSRY